MANRCLQAAEPMYARKGCSPAHRFESQTMCFKPREGGVVGRAERSLRDHYGAQDPFGIGTLSEWRGGSTSPLLIRTVASGAPWLHIAIQRTRGSQHLEERRARDSNPQPVPGTTFPVSDGDVPRPSIVAYLVYGWLVAQPAKIRECPSCPPTSGHLATDWLHGVGSRRNEPLCLGYRGVSLDGSNRHGRLGRLNGGSVHVTGYWRLYQRHDNLRFQCCSGKQRTGLGVDRSDPHADAR